MKRGPKTSKRISIIWSRKLAYAVGLIATDGNLSKDGRHIDFTSKDLQLIRTFQRCLGIEKIKIGTKLGGYSTKHYYRVQFGDVHFYNWLVQIGLMPRKSLRLHNLDIPAEFFFDFLRGCFDGDGTIYSFWDKRWPNSFMFYIAFTSGSREFIFWLQTAIKKYSNVQGRVGSLAKGVYQLRFAKSASVVLFKRMFYSANVPHLERKLRKAKIIFKEAGVRFK